MAKAKGGTYISDIMANSQIHGVSSTDWFTVDCSQHGDHSVLRVGSG